MKTALNLDNITRDIALEILNLPDEDLPELLEHVYAIRKKHKGNMVNVQILSNARSGNCTQNCAYCAQSRESKADIDKYSFIEEEKLISHGKLAREKGVARHCIGLSGISFTDEEINTFANEIRLLKKDSSTPICCSIGFLTKEQATTLKEAGVDRINHNLNTSRNYYPSICTTHTFEQRIENIKMLQGMGFEICCGGIIGLGEEKYDVADMLLEIQALRPQSVPINFLIPIDGTPLAGTDTAHLTSEYCLKVLCLTRLLNPEADIRCAAGREIYLKGKEKLMFCAVNSIFASGYLTTGGQGIEDTIKVIKDAGFEYSIENP